MRRKDFLTTVGLASACLTNIPLISLYANEKDSILNRIKKNRERLAKKTDNLSIHGIQLPDYEIGQYEKYEIKFQVEATYENPYDPDDINVQGLIRIPSGRKIKVPAFFFEPCQPEEDLSKMTMGVLYNRKGGGEWHLRFSSPEKGTHTFILEAKEKSGMTTSSHPIQFDIIESSRPGYIQVSKSNPLYFENSRDNSLFWGVGTNIAWTRSRNYEYYFGKAKNNMNATRVWLCHWAWLEWTPFNDQPMTNWSDYGGVLYYNQMIADTLDRIFEQAEKQNLRIMLVTEDNNEHFDDNSAGGWAGNPYNKIFGGPCDLPGEVFSLSEAKNLYQKRLRYILARWGYSDSLWIINSWNDMSNPDEVRLNWIKEMRDYTHKIVDGWRPIIYGSNFQFKATEVTDYAQAGAELILSKPNVIQEGYHSDSDDWFRQSVSEQTWLSLARGLAAWMVWPHEQVDRTNSWDVFQPTMKFAAEQELNKGNWQAAKAYVRDVSVDGSEGGLMEFVSLQAYGDIPEWGFRSTENKFYVEPAAVGGQWLKGFSRTLYGIKYEKWRYPPTFLATLPAPGLVTIDILEIGSGSSQIAILVNGIEETSKTYESGRRYLRDNESRISAELPAGEVEINIDITSGDWIRLRTIYISWEMQSPTQLIKVEGRSHSVGGFLYLQNKTFDRNYQEVLKLDPVLLKEVILDVQGIIPGNYRITQIAPETGEVINSEVVNFTESESSYTIEELKQSKVLAIEII